jgi:sialic acid synthase SpsE
MNPPIRIADKMVGPGYPTYVIAEIGSNHNQDLGLALRMIEQAAEAGADAVKFQSIRYDKLYKPEQETAEFADWIAAIELDEKWYPRLAQQCRDCGVHFLSSPTYAESVPLLEACGVPAYKIASPQAQANLPLVEQVARQGKPMIVSMGYAGYGEIDRVIRAVEAAGNHLLIPLHCVSQYPVEPAQANLRFMQTLVKMTGYNCGFSDHSMGSHLAVAAVALGAVVVEKHVTQDRSMPGPDHKFAMLFDEFSTLVSHIRDTEQALGGGRRIQLGSEEQGYRHFVALKVFARRDLVPGELLTEADLEFTRSNREGVLHSELPMLLRCAPRRAVAAGQLLQWADLQLGDSI